MLAWADEVFGPVVSVVTAESIDAAIGYVDSITRDPLALYIFSSRTHVVQVFVHACTLYMHICVYMCTGVRALVHICVKYARILDAYIHAEIGVYICIYAYICVQVFVHSCIYASSMRAYWTHKYIQKVD